MEIEKNVLYEDNHILVVVKPQNLPTQEDESKDKDLLTILKSYIKQKYNKQGDVYLGLVHRLDRPTGGVMVFAKTSKSATRLSEQIKNHKMKKEYLCVVNGVPAQSRDTLSHYLKKNEKENTVSIVTKSEEGAKEAVLSYEVISSKSNLSLVKVELKTGRSHQIRVQMGKGISTPLYGDFKYGDKKHKSNLALWAYRLSFEHPTLKKDMVFVVMPDSTIKPFDLFQDELEKISK